MATASPTSCATGAQQHRGSGPLGSALSAYIATGAALESAAFRAREVVRLGHLGGAWWLDAADRAAAIRRDAHREARAALADRWLEPRQVQLLLLALAEVVQASADDAASADSEDAWIAAVSGLEAAAASIDKAVDLERDAPLVSWTDVLEAAERVLS